MRSQEPHHVAERGPVDVLHREVLQVVALTGREYRHDVRLVQLRQHFLLAQETGAEIRRRLAIADHLQRHAPKPQADLLRLVNFAHATLRQKAHDAKIVERIARL